MTSFEDGVTTMTTEPFEEHALDASDLVASKEQASTNGGLVRWSSMGCSLRSDLASAAARVLEGGGDDRIRPPFPPSGLGSGFGGVLVSRYSLVGGWLLPAWPIFTCREIWCRCLVCSSGRVGVAKVLGPRGRAERWDSGVRGGKRTGG